MLTYPAICFRCKTKFRSENKEAIHGDLECQKCNTKSQQVARMVDSTMANRPKKLRTNALEGVPIASRGRSGLILTPELEQIFGNK
tara:strand:+ start:1923 stop:2180 length:258 start_codon:yes stop_codon:yes gene_type:complete